MRRPLLTGLAWAMAVVGLLTGFGAAPGCDYDDFIRLWIAATLSTVLVAAAFAGAAASRMRSSSPKPWLLVAVALALGSLVGGAAGLAVADARSNHDECRSN